MTTNEVQNCRARRRKEKRRGLTSDVQSQRKKQDQGVKKEENTAQRGPRAENRIREKNTS